MKTKLKFFVFLFMLMAPLVSGAASNGCDNPDNEYIAPELALCSTHVYNIGLPTNPTDDTNRGYMKDVVALKTTIMTQQLNKQYEYLESMIRRFKTQLEKAILTTKLQTSGAGGASSGGSSGFKSDDNFIVLSGTQNCLKMVTIDASLSCLQSNVRIAMDAVTAGNVRDAKKQLEKDAEAAKTMGITEDSCNSMNASKKDTVSGCATALNYKLMQKIDDRSREMQRQRQ